MDVYILIFSVGGLLHKVAAKGLQLPCVTWSFVLVNLVTLMCRPCSLCHVSVTIGMETVNSAVLIYYKSWLFWEFIIYLRKPDGISVHCYVLRLVYACYVPTLSWNAFQCCDVVVYAHRCRWELVGMFIWVYTARSFPMNCIRRFFRMLHGNSFFVHACTGLVHYWTVHSAAYVLYVFGSPL
jgi:hypothetical protein